MIAPLDHRRCTIAVLLVTLLTTSGLINTASPVSAMQTGYYSVGYSGDLYRYYNEYGNTGFYKASHDEWASDHFPSPIPINSDYVKYPWSDQIYAVTFFGQTQDLWLWQHLDFSQWAQVGYPQPRTAGWIQGSEYYKWATSDELFVTLNGQVHRLSFDEWAASGFQQPTFYADQGYMKLSWDDGIAQMWQIGAGSGGQVNYAEWASAGFPTPQVRSTLPGDTICSFAWTPDLYYEGASHYGWLTYAQWRATGFKAPVRC